MPLIAAAADEYAKAKAEYDASDDDDPSLEANYHAALDAFIDVPCSTGLHVVFKVAMFISLNLTDSAPDVMARFLKSLTAPWGNSSDALCISGAVSPQ